VHANTPASHLSVPLLSRGDKTGVGSIKKREFTGESLQFEKKGGQKFNKKNYIKF